MKLATIPQAEYQNYRLNVMFDSYKWDLQANEQSTISDKVLLLEREEAEFLANHAVQLYNETIAMEHALKNSPASMLTMGISEDMAHALGTCDYDPTKHIRFMRFDFHPTIDGWQISEVNSDVPAGYPEASILPALAQPYFSGYKQYGCFGTAFKHRMSALVPTGATIAYLHDTHTVEDYQILHYLGDLMEAAGYKSMYASPSHVKWGCVTASPLRYRDSDTSCISNLAACRQAEDIGGIVRYFPVEWLECTPNMPWRDFVNSQTPSCNHPIALLTQSKRLPVVWDELGVNVSTWKKLLPETVCAGKFSGEPGWILKPAFGRVGEGITIPGTMSEEEENAVRHAAKHDPTQWVAQRLFESAPIDGTHINVGVFVMDGQFAGFFSRISASPRMDEDASEIPILVRGDI